MQCASTNASGGMALSLVLSHSHTHASPLSQLTRAWPDRAHSSSLLLHLYGLPPATMASPSDNSSPFMQQRPMLSLLHRPKRSCRSSHTRSPGLQPPQQTSLYTLAAHSIATPTLFPSSSWSNTDHCAASVTGQNTQLGSQRPRGPARYVAHIPALFPPTIHTKMAATPLLTSSHF